MSVISDHIKLELIRLVKGDGVSIRTAAERLGVSHRTATDFLNKTTWKAWWAENQEYVDEYFRGFGKSTLIKNEDPIILSGGVSGGGISYVGFNAPPKMNLPPRTKENAQIYDHIRQSIENIHSSKESGIFYYGNYSYEKDNSRILLISDMHIPYHHPDTLEFLQHLKDKYSPTRVICMGDELDKHSLSFHDSDPDLPSAGDELRASLPTIQKLKDMFPVMDILESNHGSLLYRKAHAFGIPKHYLKSYNDILCVDNDWKWHYDLTVDLPNGNKCYLHHGKSANVTKTSQTMSMCAVQGHFHETFKIEYWGNPVALYWAMQTGCLIDDKSYAFNYNNVNLKRPIIGTGLIIDSMPILEPMVLDKNGRWEKV